MTPPPTISSLIAEHLRHRDRYGGGAERRRWCTARQKTSCGAAESCRCCRNQRPRPRRPVEDQRGRGCHRSCWCAARRSAVAVADRRRLVTGCASRSPTRTPRYRAIWCPGRRDRAGEWPGSSTLALVAVIGLTGPALATVPRLRIPVVIGELLAGIVVGRTGFGIVDHSDPTFTLLANIGFALVMFVVGTHVPVRDATLRTAIPKGAAAGRLRRCGGRGARRGDRARVRHRARGAVCRGDGLVFGSPGAAVIDGLRLEGPPVLSADRSDRHRRHRIDRVAALVIDIQRAPARAPWGAGHRGLCGRALPRACGPGMRGACVAACTTTRRSTSSRSSFGSA